jgi:DMSO/TMAO reductase YedYZ molybdopterin-dependent catalytic subunit
MTDDVPDDSKLTRTKSKWAEIGKFLTGLTSRPEDSRLPPGQHLVKNWPVLDLGQTPDVPTDRWKLDITGAVAKPMTFDWQSFNALPQSEKVSDIHCVTTWSRYDNHWKGVSTHDLLDAVSPNDDAKFVVLVSNDGYTTNLSLEDFCSPDAIIVHSWEGQPLELDHGGPVRLVVPHLYFWKSAKWLRRIDFATADHPGFWEVRGYHNRGDPWKEERYS